MFYDQLHAIDLQYPILNINDSTQEANIFLQEMKSFFGRKNTSNVTNCVAVIGIREALLIGMTSHNEHCATITDTGTNNNTNT